MTLKYNYNVMQEIKESLFRQNEERVSKDIQNYLFASNYEIGEKLVCPYTNEEIVITPQFFYSIEQHLMIKTANDYERSKYRENIAMKLAVDLQKMQANEEDITKTEIYRDLYNNYMKDLRKNIFEPFVEFPAFESAIKEYGTTKFEVYDQRVKDEVAVLITNLINKFNYTAEVIKVKLLSSFRNNFTAKIIFYNCHFTKIAWVNAIPDHFWFL